MPLSIGMTRAGKGGAGGFRGQSLLGERVAENPARSCSYEPNSTKATSSQVSYIDYAWILSLRSRMTGSTQDDTRGFHGHDDRARLKAGGFLPLPYSRHHRNLPPSGRQDDVVVRSFLKQPHFCSFLAQKTFQNETKRAFFGFGTAFANVSA